MGSPLDIFADVLIVG